MKEIFCGVFSVAAFIGLLTYLIRQSIWTRYIQPVISRKPKPVITFKGGEIDKTFDVNLNVDIEGEIERMMDEERKALPEAHIQNPYDNPWVLLQESPENYNVYNSQREQYLQAKEEQIRNIVNEEYERGVLVPIELVVSNDGKVPTGKCDIEISFNEGVDVYPKSAFKECTGTIFHKPVLTRGHAFPCLSLGTEEYHFRKFDPTEKVIAPLRYKLDALNQHMSNGDVIPLLYVDARKVDRLNIIWQIIEPSYQEPIIGELILNIKPPFYKSDCKHLQSAYSKGDAQN